jgi:hypothetical protein
MFVAPSWLEGLLIQAGMYVVIPLIIAIILGIVKWKKSNDMVSGFIRFALAFIVAVMVIYPIGCVYWFYEYEVPSVQEKIITVQGWEPKPGIIVNDNGMMVISNADQLLLVTTENEGFFNNENFLFQKFNTRDIFNQLKVGGTYKIKYYGWRNGFNSGFPNILSVEQVVNETGAKDNKYGDYFGTKLAI